MARLFGLFTTYSNPGVPAKSMEIPEFEVRIGGKLFPLTPWLTYRG
jgi:hypothetical protein